MLARDLYRPEDKAYLIERRRELHRVPELNYDLPETVAIVKRELSDMGIPFTEEYGKSSIVASLGKKDGPVVALRADMDALPVTEQTGAPYASVHEGKMHACGHDAHTAILLCACRLLKRAESDIPCRVRVIFQPCEEGLDSGANMLVGNGVLKDVACITGMHCDNNIEAGYMGICREPSMSARHCYDIEFFGKTAHAASPHTGHDALAMAVKAYNGITVMINREIDPLQRHLCCIGALNAGHADNVVPDYARMKISVRTFDMELDRFIFEKISLISRHAAEEMGGTAKVTDSIEAYPVLNDAAVCDRMEAAVRKALGEDHCVKMPVKMASEDFSFYTRQVPACFMGMGTRNEALGCTEALHSSCFTVDEDGLINGSLSLVQFVMDYE